MIELNTFHNCDCMQLMKEFPDKYFDLAIVDPPYGDVTKGGYMIDPVTKWNSKLAQGNDYHLAIWEQKKPPEEYFIELERVSKNQIIWGGNYFTSLIKRNSQCWLIWDKQNDGTTFADCELAYTSFNSASRIFRYRWNGMLQQNMKHKEVRIHPTQKPVALYEWILNRYAKKGDKVIDTHAGSASSLIACHNLGVNFVGCEIDEEYFKLANERLKAAQSQLSLFNL